MHGQYYFLVTVNVSTMFFFLKSVENNYPPTWNSTLTERISAKSFYTKVLLEFWRSPGPPLPFQTFPTVPSSLPSDLILAVSQ